MTSVNPFSRLQRVARDSSSVDPDTPSQMGELFFMSIRQGLRLYPKTARFRSGAGWVEAEASKLWGSNQAALSLAIWSTSQRVRELPSTYNYPLHLHARIDPVLTRTVFPHLVHVHYHWTFAEDALPANSLFLPSGPLSAGQRNWLRSASPIG